MSKNSSGNWSIFKSFVSDLAIDLGTANILVITVGKDTIISEPSVVAVQRNSRGDTQVIAVGNEAKLMLGKTPGTIQAIRPVRDGVIANFDVTTEMIKHFIKKAQKLNSSLVQIKPKVVLGVPSGITQVEKKAVKESAEAAGAREVYLIEEPMAAAIGAGLPITEPKGNMMVDIGGGTTEVAVISLSGIVFSSSTRVGGDTMDDNILQYIKRRHNMLIGDGTAERIKIKIGSAYPTNDKSIFEVKGRDLLSGIPKTIKLDNSEVLKALSDVCEQIVNAVKYALENTPPELAADVVDRGIVLSGGGSLLKNLDILIRERTSLPVIYAEDPLSCVVRGLAKALEQPELLKHLALK